MNFAVKDTKPHDGILEHWPIGSLHMLLRRESDEHETHPHPRDTKVVPSQLSPNVNPLDTAKRQAASEQLKSQDKDTEKHLKFEDQASLNSRVRT